MWLKVLLPTPRITMSEGEGSASEGQGLSAAALRAQKRQARIRANAGQRITSITSNSREGGSSYLKSALSVSPHHVQG